MQTFVLLENYYLHLSCGVLIWDAFDGRVFALTITDPCNKLRRKTSIDTDAQRELNVVPLLALFLNPNITG